MASPRCCATNPRTRMTGSKATTPIHDHQALRMRRGDLGASSGRTGHRRRSLSDHLSGGTGVSQVTRSPFPALPVRRSFSALPDRS